MKRQLVFYILFLLIVSFMRILPHPVGCSPLIAASLFIVATSGKYRKYWHFALPLFFLITAQLQSGFWQGWWIQPISLFLILLSVRGTRTDGLYALALGAFASIQFFVYSNTGSWIVHALDYPMTFSGWVECMNMGVPYFRSQLFWDIVFTAFIFWGYQLMEFRQSRLSTVPA